MGNASRSVASGPCPYVRRHVTAGVTVASAGILALGVVAAPPDSHSAQIEVRTVELTSLALPPSAYLGALEKFIGSRVPAAAPVAPVVQAGVADITTTVGSTIEPATDRQQVNTAALATPTTAFNFGAILGPLINNPIVGPIVLFGAIAFGFLVVLPVEWFVGTIYEAFVAVFGGILSLPPTLPLPGTVAALADVNAAPAPTLTSDPPLKGSAPAITAKDAPADAALGIEGGKADVSPSVTSADKRTRSEQETSHKDEVETAKTAQASTDIATSTKDAAETDSTSEPAKPKVRPATSRPVVRDSLDVSEQLPDRPHRDKGGRPTSQTSDEAATSGSTSVASPSGNSSSKRSGSSDGDAGDSK